MRNFIRYFNQNRWKIIITIIIIVFIIILIKTINAILLNNKEKMFQENKVIQDSSKPTESVLSGEEVSEKETDKNVEIIKNFVNLCNNKQYNEAYEILSNACKEEMFPNVETFIQNYVNQIFNTKKSYNLELWFYTTGDYTYRVIYFEDNILASGVVDTQKNIEDYITILKQDGMLKLNINSFIGKDDINKTISQNGIEITVNTRKVYRSYENYIFTVKNNTSKTIKLNDGQNGNDICLVDTNDVEYNSMINEVPIETLTLEPGVARTFSVSFYKMYNAYRMIESVRFKNIKTDIDNESGEYLNLELDF